MSAILPIAKKETRQILRDPRTLGVLLFIPLFLLLMFGYAISLDVKHIKLGAMDYDRSAESRELIRKFGATEYFDWHGYVEDLESVDYYLESEELQCVVVVPKGYARTLGRGETANLQILIDGTNSNVGATAMGYIQRIVQNASMDILQSRRGGAVLEGGIDLRSRVWFNPELRSPVYLIPGLISLILVVTAVISTAMSIVREKEHGTMEQLIVAPIHPIEMVLGKTIPYTLLSLLIAIMVMWAGSFFFNIEIRGNLYALFLVTLLFLIGCIGLGILISTIAESQQVAFLMAVIITMLPTFILSGFIFPIRNMPVFVRVVTYIIPARYYLVALKGVMLKGAGLGIFLPEVGALILFAVITLGISAIRMKKGGLA